MSVKVMTLVWSLDLPDSQKIVLLALADSANDEGHCWPSMASLAKKCSKGERTVQGVIRELVEAGHLTRREVMGKGCNYTVHPRRDCAPAETAPPQPLRATPAETAPHPRSRCAQTVKEPSKNRKSNARERACEKPDDVSDRVWSSFTAHRKARRAQITDLVLETIRDQANRAGWPMDAALTEMVTRNWQGFKAAWVADLPKPAKSDGSAVDPIAATEKRIEFFRRMGRDDDAAEAERHLARLRGPPLAAH